MFPEEMSVVSQSLVLLGDFNMHLDIPDKWDKKRYNDTFTEYWIPSIHR